MKRTFFISILLLISFCVYSASLVSVSPATATQGQTLAVTITGLNTHFNQTSSTISFSQASTSTVINSSNITRINDTSISASFTIPTNSATGDFNVNLNNVLDGTLLLPNGFQISADPTIKLVSVTPATATQGQTLAVTITGANTHFNQTSSTISFSQASTATIINSGSITKINDTSISASFTIPANAALGNYDVNLSNVLDGSLSKTNVFLIKTNTSLTAISPSNAIQGQTLDVTITGVNTHFNQASSTINFRQASGTIISSGTITKINDTSISASFTIPANASLGNYDVNLSNSLDGNLSIPNGFLVKSNTALTSISPSTTTQGQTLSVTITGLNTHFNQASSSISFSQASSSTIINSGTITKINDSSISASFTIPANASTGSYDVNLSNSLDGAITLYNGFVINADYTKKLTSISPETAAQGQTLSVTITGVNTHFNQTSSTISFSQASSGTIINSENITKINDSSISANFTIPANASLGSYDVNLSNSLDGSLSILNGFLVKLNTALTSVSPSTAIQGQTLTVTITGVNTHFNQASSTSLSQASSGAYINSNTLTKISDTSIQVEFMIPMNTPAGKYDLNLYDTFDGYLTLTDGFQIDANPTIRLVSISPSTATPGQALEVTITGAYTHFNQTNSSISFSQASSSTTVNSGTITKISDTSIRASFTIPANASFGNYDVNLSNLLDGSLSIPNGFRIAPITTDVSNKSILSITVYPNPFTETLTIYGFSGVGLLTISDLNGNIWLTKQVTDNKNTSVCTLSKGLYILKLITKDGIITQKIIKK
jgi:uncharacterized protein YfaS (alpha-2-macroglobulin family)